MKAGHKLKKFFYFLNKKKQKQIKTNKKRKNPKI